MRTGRDIRAGYWIPTWPKATVGAFVVSVAVTALAWQLLFMFAWTPLQRYSIKAYVGSSMAAGIGLGPKAYTLLNAFDRRGPKLAQNRDVGETVTEDGRTLLTVTADAERRGVTMLRPLDGRYQPDRLRAFLEASIYGGRSLSRLALPAVIIGSSALVGFLVFALPLDVRRSRDRRQGRRLKGPVLTDVAGFNRAVKGNGIVLYQASGPSLTLPRKAEPSHLLIMGATGTGKSAIIRQLLVQIRSRGDQAIIYDPGGTYLSLFYDPAAGDIVLNPLDARCPYWTPGDELRPGAEHAESLTMAHALFPAQQGTNPFFTDQPRRLMAYLLTKRPSPKQLIEWLTDADFLQDLLKKTGFAHTLSLDAPEQRSGVLASLNVVTDSLKVLPEEDDCRGRWSAAAWAPKRRGFIFLTSTPQTRARLIPLQSLWLDTLILRLMDGGPERPPTWFVLDEVASLNRLPQLHTAVTENRKHNNPIVIGCQGRSQLESRYGQDAETMIAQPATKILLRTSEPAAAEWASKAIGEIEIERLTESRRDAWGISWDQSHLSLHRQIERLVMASEMEGLDDLTGYVKLGNTVAPLQIRYLDLATRAQDFVPRVAPAPPVRLQPLPTDVPCVVQSLT